MRVDKNLLLNIFKERCSIYFYLERFCFSSDRLFRALLLSSHFSVGKWVQR